MEEKYLQKQQEYTFTVPRAEGLPFWRPAV